MLMSNVMPSPITRPYLSLNTTGASNIIRMLSEEEARIAKDEEARVMNNGLPTIARLALNYGNCRNSYLFIK